MANKRNSGEQALYSRELTELLSTPQWDSIREEAARTLDSIHRIMENEVDAEKFMELRAEAKAVRRIFKIGTRHANQISTSDLAELAPREIPLASPGVPKVRLGDFRKRSLVKD